MFTSIWYAALFLTAGAVLLTLTWAQARERGSHDGWFEAFDSLRVDYHSAYIDGFDDAHKQGRDTYDKGYDDGWYEAFTDGRDFGYELGYDEGWDDNRNGFYGQYAVERERGLAGTDSEEPRANLVVQVTAPDEAGYTVEEIELAELLAAERLMQALAEMSEIDDIIRHTIETVQHALQEGFKQGWDQAFQITGPQTDEERSMGHRLATEYADSFSEGISQALHGKAEDPRRGDTQ